MATAQRKQETEQEAGHEALETRDLRLVQAIAEQGGVTQAGRRLHLSQSAVSHQLAGLEERLGVALFARVRKRMVITPAGSQLLALAAELLPRLSLAPAQLRAQRANVRRRLRLTTQCFTCYHWLPGVLQKLATTHPTLDLHIAVEATRTPVEALLAGELDLALCCWPVRERSLVSLPLFEDEMVVVLPAGHPLARRPTVSGEALLGERLYFYDVPAKEERGFLSEVFGKRASEAQLLKVPLTEAILELVRAGHGVSILSRWSLGEHPARGGLEVRRLGRHGMRRAWSLVHPRATPFAQEMGPLSELLRAAMAGR